MSAPNSRYLSTISRPRPVPPPVTRMRLPLNNPGWNMVCPLREIFARALPGGSAPQARQCYRIDSLPCRGALGQGSCLSCLLLFRPDHPARCPVGFFHVAHNNFDRVGRALEHAAGFARNRFDEFTLDFGGAAFEHLDME